MKKTGKCRLCQKEGKLTYEHIPPKNAYNGYPVKTLNLFEMHKDNNVNYMPWEIDKMKGKIKQRGMGGYYLCKECNNLTGSWYAKYFGDFVKALGGIVSEYRDEWPEVGSFTIENVHYLAVFKQIITMFCVLNEHLTEDEQIRNYILERENGSFDWKKYRLFMYFRDGNYSRLCPLSINVSIDNPGNPIFCSEISFFPVGFILYQDLPADQVGKGIEITNLSFYEYDAVGGIQIPPLKYEVNSIFPLDFRSREEIEGAIKKNFQK
ncbi:hypothetical protein [Dubosiella muris]|uniref:Uncharacterized protein n=3 Tax=Dubosiella TaxID=1937008 RepID=A0AC61R9F5_9FIRM|nr:hypothetical protein [Dubosiella muris]TGY66902.1 hypothetical protein E5336_02115 [Dubosiella muris]